MEELADQYRQSTLNILMPWIQTLMSQGMSPTEAKEKVVDILVDIIKNDLHIETEKVEGI